MKAYQFPSLLTACGPVARHLHKNKEKRYCFFPDAVKCLFEFFSTAVLFSNSVPHQATCFYVYRDPHKDSESFSHTRVCNYSSSVGRVLLYR